MWGPEDVRAACAFVAGRAQIVHIDQERLEAFELPNPAPPEDVSVEFALTFNAINFGSGWHPYLSKIRGKSGNVTLSTRLREHFDARGPFTAKELAAMSADDCARVLGQHLHPPVDELMGLFAESWNDLGRFLLDRFDGSFDGPKEAAGASAARLVGLLQEMPMYRDVAVYEGRTVPFLKRAQLTASDLGGSADSNCFDDLDRLTVFADNLVPHVLRVEGILQLDAELARAIDESRLLEPGGLAEVELRAAAVHASELIAARSGGSVTPREVDNRLWRLGQEARFKASPRPRVRSCFY